jgi:hypothetical protein
MSKRIKRQQCKFTLSPGCKDKLKALAEALSAEDGVEGTNLSMTVERAISAFHLEKVGR